MSGGPENFNGSPVFPADHPGLARRIAEVLRSPGAVVMLHTETVYGLVCRAADPEACRRIYDLKHRSGNKLLGWFADSRDTLEKHGVILDGAAGKLVEKYTPGAITIIARCQDGSTCGFRIPDHPLLQQILAELREPLAQTSANRSGHPDAPDCRAALAGLCGAVDLAVDGGTLPEGSMGSTVVDATGNELKILRRGAVDPVL